MTSHFPPVVGFRPADIALSSCSVRLQSSTSSTLSACPNGLCSRASINITAAMDFMFDPDTQNLVELEVAWEEGLGDEWWGYRPQPVSVAVIDLPAPACQVTTHFLSHPSSQPLARCSPTPTSSLLTGHATTSTTLLEPFCSSKGRTTTRVMLDCGIATTLPPLKSTMFPVPAAWW